jgi:hypothetical protein
MVKKDMYIGAMLQRSALATAFDTPHGLQQELSFKAIWIRNPEDNFTSICQFNSKLRTQRTTVTPLPISPSSKFCRMINQIATLDSYIMFPFTSSLFKITFIFAPHVRIFATLGMDIFLALSQASFLPQVSLFRHVLRMYPDLLITLRSQAHFLKASSPFSSSCRGVQRAERGTTWRS